MGGTKTREGLGRGREGLGRGRSRLQVGGATQMYNEDQGRKKEELERSGYKWKGLQLGRGWVL